MPVALAAFAAGVAWLQTRAELPAAPWAWMVAALALGGIALAWGRRREAIVACTLACALGGFGYAAWRAEVRLADALPEAWEGVDIALVGVVDDLPDRSPQGVRFSLAVERVESPEAEVPRRVSLTWSAERNADGDASEAPEVHAGERWRLTARLKRPHGYANPGGFEVVTALQPHVEQGGGGKAAADQEDHHRHRQAQMSRHPAGRAAGRQIQRPGENSQSHANPT